MQFDTIKLRDKQGNLVEIIVEVPSDPKPQKIEFPSLVKEIMMIFGISFFAIIGFVFFHLIYDNQMFHK